MMGRYRHALRVLGRAMVARVREGRDGADRVVREELDETERCLERAKHEILERQLIATGAFMGMSVMRPYCDLNGHFWADHDECVVCGASWRATMDEES